MSHTSEEYCRSCTDTVHLVQGKWKIHILCSIRSGPVRVGQLRRELRTASKKVLTENLRELEDAGLVVRRDLGGSVPHVEYDFHEEMRSQIQSMLDHLADFGETFDAPQASGQRVLHKGPAPR
jgi:DNA-binding HxlR family transcriptional regulator